jgi:hypothetical protein
VVEKSGLDPKEDPRNLDLSQCGVENNQHETTRMSPGSSAAARVLPEVGGNQPSPWGLKVPVCHLVIANHVRMMQITHPNWLA